MGDLRVTRWIPRTLSVVSLLLAAAGVTAQSAGAVASPLTWEAPQSIDSHPLLALRCPGKSLCVAIDTAGNVLVTDNPGATGWSRSHLDKALTALACPSSSLCVAVDSTGHILTSRHPGGGAKTWTKTLVDTVSPGELSAVGCRPNLCVAGDNQGNAFVSTNPAGGRHAWRQISLPSNGDSPGTLSGFGCPSRSLCVGVDQSTGEGLIDDVFTSAKPTVPRSWKLRKEFTSNSFNGVACPSTVLCVAPTASGEVMTSTDPTRAASWHPAMLESGVSINAVACPSTSSCVLGDDRGMVWSSGRPAGGASSWSAQSVAPGDAIDSLACVGSRLCLAATHSGAVVVGDR